MKTEVIEVHTTKILQYLKEHGQLLDSEIAAALGIPLSSVHLSLRPVGTGRNFPVQRDPV
ncbi:MAG: hypothetical protein ACLPXB_02915 [Thiobacillaceae bacterium]